MKWPPATEVALFRPMRYNIHVPFGFENWTINFGVEWKANLQQKKNEGKSCISMCFTTSKAMGSNTNNIKCCIARSFSCRTNSLNLCSILMVGFAFVSDQISRPIPRYESCFTLLLFLARFRPERNNQFNKIMSRKESPGSEFDLESHDEGVAIDLWVHGFRAVKFKLRMYDLWQPGVHCRWSGKLNRLKLRDSKIQRLLNYFVKRSW